MIFPRLLRTFALLAMLSVCGLVTPSRSRAQTSQATRADSAAVLLDAAKHFAAAGRTDIANAIYGLIIDRYADTSAAGDARTMLGGRAREEQERSGRVELQVWSTLFGLWLGVAVPAAFGANDPAPFGVGLLVGGPVGFLTGARIAHSRPLSEGQARAITLGGTWGIWQGFGWADVTDWGEKSYRCESGVCDANGTRRRFLGTVIGGVTGMAGGTLISKMQIPAGVASTVNFGALWGTWFGLAGGVIAGIENDDLLASTLIGGDVGLLSTAVLARGWNLSRNRARLISIAGVMGGLAGAGLDLIIQPNDVKVGVGIPLGLSVVGLGMGAAATRHYDAAVRGPGDDDSGDALLELSSGHWRPGDVWPTMRMLPIETRGGRRREPGVALTLFRARF